MNQKIDFTDLNKPVKILFVCLGNICRSPSAEGVMRHIVEQNNDENNFIIDSAGTYGGHRSKYTLYDNKICMGDEAAECKYSLEEKIESIGYKISVNRGDPVNE